MTQSASNPQAPPTQTPGAELPGYPRKRVVPLQRPLPGRILTGLKQNRHVMHCWHYAPRSPRPSSDRTG